MPNTTIFDKVKKALRLTTSSFDDEITDLIDAALSDLALTGIAVDSDDNPLLIRAVITYCRANFGTPADYDRLKLSYDEQKSQMLMAHGYID